MSKMEAKYLLLFFGSASVLSMSASAMHGNGNHGISELGTLESGALSVKVNDQCQVYVHTKNDGSNIVFDGMTFEYKSNSGAGTTRSIGIGHPLGDYADLIGIKGDVVYVTSNNAGNQGAALPVDVPVTMNCETTFVDWGNCPCVQNGGAWLNAFGRLPHPTRQQIVSGSALTSVDFSFDEGGEWGHNNEKYFSIYPDVSTTDPITTCQYEVPFSGVNLRSEHIRLTMLDEEIAACAAGLDSLYGRLYQSPP